MLFVAFGSPFHMDLCYLTIPHICILETTCPAGRLELHPDSNVWIGSRLVFVSDGCHEVAQTDRMSACRPRPNCIHTQHPHPYPYAHLDSVNQITPREKEARQTQRKRERAACYIITCTDRLPADVTTRRARKVRKGLGAPSQSTTPLSTS